MARGPRPIADPTLTESFEILAFHVAEPIAAPITVFPNSHHQSLTPAGTELSLPPPRRQRFTWESPEMYQAEQD